MMTNWKKKTAVAATARGRKTRKISVLRGTPLYQQLSAQEKISVDWWWLFGFTP
jgi:hypothetical protein